MKFLILLNIPYVIKISCYMMKNSPEDEFIYSFQLTYKIKNLNLDVF
jgi:hypothetical protein